MRKTILAFASVLIMLAAGVVLVGASDDSDAADTIPAPEKPGLEGYPITVFKQDGSKVGLNTLTSNDISNGDEIWIYSDVNVSVLTINGKNVKIHLHYATMALANYIDLYEGTLDLEGNGTIQRNRNSGGGAIFVNGSLNQENYSTLNLGSDVTIRSADSGVIVWYYEGNSSKCSGVEVNINGTITAGTFAITVNGNIRDEPKVNVNPGAVLQSENACAIYASGNSKWNINGASITGTTGIEVRAGTVTISNSTIIGTATPIESVPNAGGSTTEGAGIAIIQHTTKQNVNVTVNSGEIRGYTAFYENNTQENSSVDIQKIRFTINGGTFVNTNGGQYSVFSQNKTGFINGGTFFSEPTALYIASNKTLTSSNGRWYVSTPIVVTTPENIDVATGSIVNTDLGSTTDTSINMQSTGVKLAISGESGLGNIVVSAEERTFPEAPKAAAAFEITIVTSTNYNADITVPVTVPYGHTALAYYIDANGNLVPVDVVGYTSNSVTFRTNHTTPFVIMTEEIVIPEVPGDDDEYPFLPGQGTNQGSQSSSDSSDDNTKLVAAAAAIVVIMLAVVAIMVTKKD